MNKHASQPRAIYYVVALQIWEYFSFYGMRALLILYLTNQLNIAIITPTSYLAPTVRWYMSRQSSVAFWRIKFSAIAWR